MRTTVTISISLFSAVSMIGLCWWEYSRVSRTIVAADGTPVTTASGRLKRHGATDTTGTTDTTDTDGDDTASGESNGVSDVDPLFPSDDHLRSEMQAILADAALALPRVLAQQPTARRRLEGDAAADRQSGEESEAALRHWAFRPLRPVAPPSSADSQVVDHPIDAFIVAKLEEQGLSLNPPATPAVLIRRLSYDLRGLPPDPADVESWRQHWSNQVSNTAAEWNSSAKDAYVELIEQYLADNAYGEHWARMWLDVTRYADSEGYESDELRPHAYPYRDFVIWAWNNDLPFDRFVQWQIAGDELAPEFAPAVAATGFLAAAPHNTFMPQPSERYDELHDILSTIGSGILGLSIGCARCHDHFYDPIPTEEYYRLVAVFESARRDWRFLGSPGAAAIDRYAEQADGIREREAELQEILERRIRHDKVSRLDFTQAEKALLLDPHAEDTPRRRELLSRCGGCLRVDGSDFVDGLQPLPEDADRFEHLRREIEKLRAHLPPAPPQVLMITGSEALTTHVLAGGSLERKGKRVSPGFLTALTDGTADWDEGAWRDWLPPGGEGDRPRTALALWMTDVEHGAGALVARVIVNRIWQQYFDRGLVTTANDFGTQGHEPSHPELLDWLANELIASGWRLKHIHRLIVTSRTYRQSSLTDARKLERDPANALFSRYRRKRLTAEMLRDSILSVTGALNRTMYGPSIFPPIPRDAIYSDDYELDAKWPTDVEEGPEVWRRSIYVALRRSNTVPLLSLFDGPDGGMCRAKRAATTSPLQCLALLNSPFVRLQAEILAQHLSDESIDLEDQVRLLYYLVFQREPLPVEYEEIYDLIRQRRSESDDVYDVDVMTDVCQALFMSNAFLFVD